MPSFGKWVTQKQENRLRKQPILKEAEAPLDVMVTR
jgi:hypothetical protein